MNVKGSFIYDADSRRYHRFKFEADQGVVGVLYVPKDAKTLPDTVTLERVPVPGADAAKVTEAIKQAQEAGDPEKLRALSELRATN